MRTNGRLGKHKAPAGKFTGKKGKKGSKRKQKLTMKEKKSKRGKHKNKYQHLAG